MKQLLKKTFYFFLLLASLNACQSVKEGLTGQKKSNSDEFLIEKKNPLVLPKEYNKLPEPTELSEKEKNDEKEIDLKRIISKDKNSSEKISVSKTSNGSLEKSVLEKIKSN